MSTNPPNKPHYFEFNKLAVFFKHTDYHGFVHPYNFYEWTSYVREAFFQSAVSNFEEVLARPIKMMTVKIGLESGEDATFGDHFQARLTVGKIKKVSFDMIIRFVNLQKKNIACKSTHTIVFVDSLAGKFANVPDEMKKVIHNYTDGPQMDNLGKSAD